VNAPALFARKWRSFTALVCAVVVSACTGTEGDLLRTRPGTQPPGDAGAARPRPAPLSTWQIQLSGALDTTEDAEVYTVDLETPAATLGALRAAGRIVLCYFSAGTMEPFRDDAARFPEGSLGAPLADYPNERWVDVRDPTVRAIMQDRAAKAAQVGCDGVHPSGLAAFQADTELAFNRSDQLAYNRWLAGVTHARGLSIGLVEGDASLSQELVADFDWSVAWSCLDTSCPSATPFVSAKKAAFLIEYGDATRAAAVCPRAKALGLSATIKRDSDLDSFRVGCP
jgi:hypothetical protein